MSIREVTMYRVECDADGCTESPVDGSEYVAWSDHDGALADLEDAWDWFTRNGQHFCPDHAPRCARPDCGNRLARWDEGEILCEDHR